MKKAGLGWLAISRAGLTPTYFSRASAASTSTTAASAAGTGPRCDEGMSVDHDAASPSSNGCTTNLTFPRIMGRWSWTTYTPLDRGGSCSGLGAEAEDPKALPYQSSVAAS